jgi:hypothetical protein
MFNTIFNLKIDYKQYSFFLLALINILTTPPSLPLKGRSYLLASLKGEELSLDLLKVEKSNVQIKIKCVN